MTSMPPASWSPPRAAIAAAIDDSPPPTPNPKVVRGDEDGPPRRDGRKPTRRATRSPRRTVGRNPPPRCCCRSGRTWIGSCCRAARPTKPDERRSDTSFIMRLAVLPKETRPVADPAQPKLARSRRVTSETPQAAILTRPTPTRSAHAPARHERTVERVDRCDATHPPYARGVQPASGSHPG
jgi:hypothetical protein